MRLLIPWDELSREQQEAISGDILFYENVMKHCTTPLRTPDDIPQPERELLWNKWNRMSWDDVYRDIIRTATRPPKKSAVEEMDAFYGTDAIVTYAEGKRIWQAVKREKGL